MNLDVEFTAHDARYITQQRDSAKGLVFHKFHVDVINRIRQKAERGEYSLLYHVPFYRMGWQRYTQSHILHYLATRLKSDGFTVVVDIDRYQLYISWLTVQDFNNMRFR